jgi:hypothetical protein
MKNNAKSRAYASTVFGDRSIPVSHLMYSSTGATGRRSEPITVHESIPDDGKRTLRAR